MTAPVFIGDETTAAAYRLAGMLTRAPKKSEVARAFNDATAESRLVILSAEYAAELPVETLRDAMRRADPLILIVPDGGNRHVPDDLDSRVDRVLGIER